jgi:hypothetical protein
MHRYWRLSLYLCYILPPIAGGDAEKFDFVLVSNLFTPLLVGDCFVVVVVAWLLPLEAKFVVGSSPAIRIVMSFEDQKSYYWARRNKHKVPWEYRRRAMKGPQVTCCCIRLQWDPTKPGDYGCHGDFLELLSTAFEWHFGCINIMCLESGKSMTFQQL